MAKFRVAGLSAGVVLVLTGAYQLDARAGVLNGLLQGFYNKVSADSINLVGNVFQRTTGVSFNKLRDDTLDDLFGKHPDAKIAKKNQGKMGIPDPIKTKQEMETQQEALPEPTGVNDANGAISGGERVREAARVTARTFADLQLSSEQQETQRAALDATQQMMAEATQVAQQSQSLTVTQDVMKANIALTTTNGHLLSALLAQQQQANTTASMALGQMSEINRHLEAMAQQRHQGITAESARAIVSSAAGGFF